VASEELSTDLGGQPWLPRMREQGHRLAEVEAVPALGESVEDPRAAAFTSVLIMTIDMMSVSNCGETRSARAQWTNSD
jgi:hypothetical protein